MADSKDRDINLEQLSAAAQGLKAFAKPIFDFLTFLIPLVITHVQKVYAAYLKLPQNFISFLIGSVFCFFGGLYPTLFAAIQAAEYGGRKKVAAAFKDLADEAMVIIEASKKDDMQDDNKDGTSDVKELSPSEFLRRKTTLVLRKMNPEKVDRAIQTIYQVWLAVAAVLVVKFARVISMTLSIAEFLRNPCDRFIAPTINMAVPDEYEKWVPVILGWITRGIAMSIAWYIQTLLSAVSSALTGGLIMARAAYHFCLHRNWKVAGLIPDNHEDSHLDEFLSYIFAAAGLYFQFKIGFSMPAPFNLILWPFELAEYYIRWSITNKAAPI